MINVKIKYRVAFVKICDQDLKMDYMKDTLIQLGLCMIEKDMIFIVQYAKKIA